MLPKIHKLNRRDFTIALNAVTSHSHPIESEPHLKGRKPQVQSIEQAVLTRGRHVFVFGERGVGKTSLAKTAGMSTAGEPKNFRQIGCAADSTFEEIIRQVVEFFGREKLAAVEKERGWSIAAKIFGIEGATRTQYQAPMLSVSTAADIISSLDECDLSDDQRVVVIDEMDKLPNTEAKSAFADLIKLLGDRGARITFIFTGVGKDFKAILGHHPSSYRHLTQIPLERLHYQAALDIVDDVLERFGLSWDVEPTRTMRFRIAAIGNGFPYYVHLLVEKLLYALYEDEEAESVGGRHLQTAVEAAVLDVEEVIRTPYDVATKGRNHNVKLAIWAAADSWDLERSPSSIHQSYKRICKETGMPPLESRQFSAVLARLKQPNYGTILRVGYRKGLCEFSENIIRGYVRLCAAAEGIELHDLQYSQAEPRQVAAIRGERRYVDPRWIGGPPPLLRR